MSAKQKGKGLAQDLLLISSDWGFELSDVQDRYKGPLHIFNGDQDVLVPLGLQEIIKRQVGGLHQFLRWLCSSISLCYYSKVNMCTILFIDTHKCCITNL